MPTQTVNLTLQQDITRVALQALISGSTVIPKRTYRITDAIGPTAEIILVKGLTTNTITGYAINETTNEWGTYNIGTDVFTVQGAIGDFIPYDAANQTQDITGGVYTVDPSTGTGFQIVGGAITTKIVEQDGVVAITVSDSSTGEEGTIAVDALAAQSEVTNTATDQAATGAVNVSGIVSSFLRTTLAASPTLKVEVFGDKIQVVTPFVAGAGNPTGMRLVGQNSAGDVEFESDAIPQQVATEVNVNSHGFVVGDWLYLNGATWTKAIATSEAASNVLGVVSTVVDANNFVLTHVGYIATLSGLGASGLVFYLSPTTAGSMTTTKPTTVGHVIRKVFVSQTNNAGWVLQEHTDKVERTVRVSGSNVTTTSTTESVVTGLTIPVEANALYKGRVTLRIGCSGSGGVRFGFNFPAGATCLAGYVGNSTATTAQQMFSGSLTSGVSATTAFNTLNAQSGFVTIDFTLEVAGTGGNVELVFRSGTNLETSTVYTNMSNMELRRIDI